MLAGVVELIGFEILDEDVVDRVDAELELNELELEEFVVVVD